MFCENKLYRSTAQSSLYIGSAFGLLLLGIFADNFGRKKGLIISLIIDIFGAFCKLKFISIIIIWIYTK